MAPPALLDLDEIVEEILLRVPPGDPARLVHAALVCKPWCRLISGSRFRRRYRELHGAVPMLGFLCSIVETGILEPRIRAQFISTSSFRPIHTDDSLLDSGLVLDARHGRVLLQDPHNDLVVWDPSLLNKRSTLPSLIELASSSVWNAAVLCAASTTSDACDHLDCHRGPFLVVYVAGSSSDHNRFSIRVYSSQDGSWSEPTISSCLHYGISYNEELLVRAVVGNTIYFSLLFSRYIIKYNLGTDLVSFIERPPSSSPSALMIGEDGRLGLATVDNSRLCLWSRQDDPVHVDADGWVRTRVIELKELLPCSALLSTRHEVVGAADGIGVIFLRTYEGTFTINLKSGRATKVCVGDHIYNIVPYMSFYPPVRGLASENEGSSTSVSAASRTEDDHSRPWKLQRL